MGPYGPIIARAPGKFTPEVTHKAICYWGLAWGARPSKDVLNLHTELHDTAPCVAKSHQMVQIT